MVTVFSDSIPLRLGFCFKYLNVSDITLWRNRESSAFPTTQTRFHQVVAVDLAATHRIRDDIAVTRDSRKLSLSGLEFIFKRNQLLRLLVVFCRTPQVTAVTDSAEPN